MAALCAAVLLAVFCSPGLARTGPAPASFNAAVTPIGSLDRAIMPPVDEAQYLREDAALDAKGGDHPLRFAAPLPTQLRPGTDGTWDRLADGSRVWRIRVISDGARTLNFGLKDLRLPPGTGVYFYATGSGEYDGPYTPDDVTPDGQFWTAVISGDDAVIELDLPARVDFEPELTVAQVNHDYRGLGKIFDGAREGACNIDVICPQGDPWRNDIRSEGDYTLNGYFTCSGQMINSNVPGTPPPYFLTAYHCGITSGNASSFVVYWKYEAPTCGLHCCGPLTNHQSGSSLKARYSTSDFCLIQLNQAPADSANVYMAGWDATLTNMPSSAVAIHHPNCDVKAISFCNTPLRITSWGGDTSPGDGTHWRVDHYDLGTTEPGSSGGGLWDPNHHLVGQLHGGYASCSSITQDWYGRLPISWTGGGSSSTRLSDWLDPNHTGSLVLDGRNPTDPTAVGQPSSLSLGTGLSAIEPNPAAGEFTILFALARPGSVTVELYDASGRVVASRPAQLFGAGSAAITMNARDRSNGAVAPGIYFVRLLQDGRALGSQKLVVVK